MKEIDFLPQWYNDKKRLKSRYRIQYLGIASLVAVMVAWTAAMSHSISRAERHLERVKTSRAACETTEEFRQMRSHLDTLHIQDGILSEIDQHLSISGAIGELSFLCGNHVRFSRIAITAERFPEHNPADNLAANTVRAVRDAVKTPSGPHSGDIRFKVTLRGVAADATQVAALIRRLEASAWFRDVTPSFSKNGQVGEHVVSEFEITCYVANYTEDPRPANETATNSPAVSRGSM
ncbi:MAG TPA: PilN domain-containing protein [Sedimentisphaerales bacterium]|nr:PilN domain-containing protein [Sedimentisphaerales bacterium]